MRILLSVKPEFALKIFDGSKRYEYRRVIFKNQEIRRVIVYVSDPIKRIMGEFEIEDILHDEPQVLWVKTKNHAGISEKRFFEYFTNKSKGYAIKIKATKIYDDPLPLNSFMIASPPQSFMYLQQAVWYHIVAPGMARDCSNRCVSNNPSCFFYNSPLQ